jgi:antitoxin HicB
MRHAYTAILEQDPEGGYVVWVPALPGCVTHGDSMGEALLMIEDAACLYLEDLATSGQTAPPDAAEFIVALR